MINLAVSNPSIHQIKKINSIIIDELETAKIDVVANLNMLDHSEVPTHLTGKYYDLTFQRYWRYWVVDGYMPLDFAQEIYATDIGKKYIRAGGHGQSLSPETQAKLLNIHDKRYVIDDDKYENYCNDCKEFSSILNDLKTKFIRKSECSENDMKLYILSYHIDSQEGLNLFKEIAEKHSIKQFEERIWGVIKSVRKENIHG